MVPFVDIPVQPQNQQQYYGLHNLSTPLSLAMTDIVMPAFKQTEQTLTATTPTELQFQPNKNHLFTQQSIQYQTKNTFTNLFKRQLSEPIPKRKSIDIMEESKDSRTPSTLQETPKKSLDLGVFLKRRTTLPTLDLPTPVGQSLDFKLSLEKGPTTLNDDSLIFSDAQDEQKKPCKNDTDASGLHFKDDESNSHASLDFTDNSINIDVSKAMFSTKQCKQSSSPSDNVFPANELLNNLIELENDQQPLRSFSMSSSSAVSSNGDDDYEAQPITKMEENNKIIDKKSLKSTTKTSVTNTKLTSSKLNATTSSPLEIGNKINSSRSSSSKSKEKNKPKRIRTSFKVHQLIAMKELFESDKNPDSSKLAVLSKTIDLPKRVLQVWFQNARAKSRKGHSVFSDNIEKLLLQSSEYTNKGSDAGEGGNNVITDVVEENEKDLNDVDIDHLSAVGVNTELSTPEVLSLVVIDETKSSNEEKS